MWRYLLPIRLQAASPAAQIVQLHLRQSLSAGAPPVSDFIRPSLVMWVHQLATPPPQPPWMERQL